MLTPALPWLHGAPQASGIIKATPDDFLVIEDLGYSADGEGEQLLVRLRKTGCNTRFVADALARFLKVPQRDVSFAGMKDRHAVTEQTFCVRLPGKQMPDLTGFQLDGVEILDVVRHQRKIRTGALAGNAFRLVIREVSDQALVEQRLPLIQRHGVPNYFGEQRFGRNGHNLVMAEQWARGEIAIRDRHKRSLLLSAARSALFNQVTSQRLTRQGNLETVLAGDVVQLAGRGSWFVAQPDELSEITQRLAQQQLRITAPLPGRGDPGTQLEALAFEQTELSTAASTLELLSREKVDAGRRAMLLVPRDFNWQWLDPQTLTLNFWLPAGSFATMLVRELVQDKSAERYSE